MTDSHDPVPNVYTVAQRKFRAIPGAPWVYWIPEGIRRLFEELRSLSAISDSHNGINTGKNERFMRYWWEIVDEHDRFSTWKPFVSGGEYRKWYGNYDYVVKMSTTEMALLPGSALRARHKWYQQGVTYVKVSSKGFNARYLPPGFVFSSGGNATFLHSDAHISSVLGLMNSSVFQFFLRLINPTVNYQTGDVAKVPIPSGFEGVLHKLVISAVHLQQKDCMVTETTFDFIAPPRWDTGLEDLVAAQARLAELERRIDEEVYRLYGISDEDRAAIEAELAGGSAPRNDGDQAGQEPPMSREELAVRWVSYAVGVVMGRFRPGLPRERDPHRRGPPGRAVFHPDDFAVGSLPAPDAEAFDALVGPVERFAYVDAQGGRHLFPAEVEEQLRALALPEGIAVLDKDHPHDLATRVERALALMWGEEGLAEIVAALGGDLRRFLERRFWTHWHLKWYRQRPIYWLLQSPRGSYSLYLYHERVTRDTLFTVQRAPYLETKVRSVDLALRDGYAALKTAQGREKRALQKQIEEGEHLLQELEEFGQRLKRVTAQGYDPDLDDGVLLNLAPLHAVVPWPRRVRYQGRQISELEATWRRLEAGEYDWAHIALRHWPERVRAKCREDKSLAIAHGHLEWYQGG